MRTYRYWVEHSRSPVAGWARIRPHDGYEALHVALAAMGVARANAADHLGPWWRVKRFPEGRWRRSP